jgi:5'-nucleotidase
VPGSVKLNGIPLEMERSYRVVTNNFLAEGGDGFPTFTKGGSRAHQYPRYRCADQLSGQA